MPFGGGDFNRHHPLWEEERNHHLFTDAALRQAQPLLDLVATYNMKMALPRNIPTLEQSQTKNWTRPDNVFASESILDAFIRCDTAPERRPPKADHLPICSTIDISLIQRAIPQRRNWRTVDWKDFREALENRLGPHPHLHRITDHQSFQDEVDFLEKALQDTVQQVVPLSRPSPFAKRWWTKELSQARAKFQKLSNRSHRRRLEPDHPVHEEMRRACNDYTELVKTTKEEHWINWLEETTEESVWNVHRLVSGPSSDGGRTRIPNLHTTTRGRTNEARLNEDKAKMLHTTFFPPPPTTVQHTRGRPVPKTSVRV
jgi:hypothetical protein